MKDKHFGKARRAFLKTATLALSLTTSLVMGTTSNSCADVGEPEKEDLKFGFIKLTDMAPLAIAYEKGYFEDEGLYVTLEAQANWKVLLLARPMILNTTTIARRCSSSSTRARNSRVRMTGKRKRKPPMQASRQKQRSYA